ncbi:MAG TPA: HupE/UreJ family protein, partial [Polyangium sp.]|nr:HupE/UreJ family protein [Polyangium sp.]
VEPLIALSVAYVGVENQFVKDADKRWRITFPFGLIHGFGFAGALGEIQLPKADVPKALLGFNLGVEAGQIATLAVVLPLIAVARKRKWLDDRGVRRMSWAIAVLGLVWFVLRIAAG